MTSHEQEKASRTGTRLTREDYLGHIMSESARFRDVLAHVAPGTRVPTCPDWDGDDLLWHLAQVQDFWARMVFDRPVGPDAHTAEERPADHAGLLSMSEAASARLAGALEGVDSEAEAWTWHHADHTVGFILRRQAHEALIHRLDAELTAGLATGESSEVDPELAADCVEEALDVLYGSSPAWGSWEGLPAHVRVDCTDTDDQVWVQLGRFRGHDPDADEDVDEEDLHVVADPGHEPDVVVQGTAADLAAWLWDRGDEARLTVTGDEGLHRRFRTIVSAPLN